MSKVESCAYRVCCGPGRLFSRDLVAPCYLPTPAFTLAGALLQLLVVYADAEDGRSGSEQLRFTNWHDKLADRRKGLYEGSTQMITIQQSREIALRAIARHMRARPGGAVPATMCTRVAQTPLGDDL